MDMQRRSAQQPGAVRCGLAGAKPVLLTSARLDSFYRSADCSTIFLLLEMLHVRPPLLNDGDSTQAQTAVDLVTILNTMPSSHRQRRDRSTSPSSRSRRDRDEDSASRRRRSYSKDEERFRRLKSSHGERHDERQRRHDDNESGRRRSREELEGRDRAKRNDVDRSGRDERRSRRDREERRRRSPSESSEELLDLEALGVQPITADDYLCVSLQPLHRPQTLLPISVST